MSVISRSAEFGGGKQESDVQKVENYQEKSYSVRLINW